MNIGELAQKTGLAASRIRFYEKIGLLTHVHRKANGYRSYPPEAVTILELITSGQQAGFSLDELRTLLPENLAQWDHQSLLTTLKQKIQDLEELERKVAKNRAMLVKIYQEIQAKPDDIDCIANAERILTGL